MKYLICAFLLLASLLSAQTAKVIALSPDDAAQAAALHNELVAAQKAVADFDTRMETQYTGCKKSDKGCHGSSVLLYAQTEISTGSAKVEYLKDGWEYGIEYSDDWRFIVPKSATVATSGTGLWSNAHATWCEPNRLTVAPMFYQLDGDIAGSGPSSHSFASPPPQ